jgi:hypothetical protein
MDFIEFLNEMGEVAVASLLGTTRQTVQSWRLGKSCPRPQMAYNLIELTHGKLTWGGIYNKYCKAHQKEHLYEHKRILKNVLDK